MILGTPDAFAILVTRRSAGRGETRPHFDVSDQSLCQPILGCLSSGSDGLRAIPLPAMVVRATGKTVPDHVRLADILILIGNGTRHFALGQNELSSVGQSDMRSEGR